MLPQAQDAVAEAMLNHAEIGALDAEDDIEPEHTSAVLEGLAQAERREFSTTKRSLPSFAASVGKIAGTFGAVSNLQSGKILAASRIPTT